MNAQIKDGEGRVPREETGRLQDLVGGGHTLTLLDREFMGMIQIFRKKRSGI